MMRKMKLALSMRLMSTATGNRFHAVKNQHLVNHLGYINGQFTAGSAKGTFPVKNPANGETLGEVARMTAADADHASKVAFDSWQSWKETTANERSKLLTRFSELMQHYREDLATILTLEAGKPLPEARGELQYAISFIDYYAEECKRVTGDILQTPARNRRLLSIKQPIGPAALITPWNFPSAMITRKLAPALGAGCTAVIKPSEDTPYSALAICAIAQEAGIPPGVVNCVTVGREEVQDVGRALCNSKHLRKVSFTGSTAVGKWLMREAASTVKKVSLELGGNAPFIVFDDADLDLALQALMAAKFRNAGQACIASNRILVQAGVYDKFSAMVTEAVNKLNVGDGFHDNVHIGPLINAQGLKKVATQVDDCVARGATILTGGKPVAHLNAKGGLFFQPTVISGLTKEMLPYAHETFGPVLPLMKFTSDDEAIALANDTEFGLAAYFCTSNLGRAWYVAEALEVGIVGVNDGAVSLASTPFGGWKESGLGREGGHQGINEYLEEKYISMNIGKRHQ